MPSDESRKHRECDRYRYWSNADAQSTNKDAIAIGDSAKSTADGAIAIGGAVNNKATNSIVIGNGRGGNDYNAASMDSESTESVSSGAGRRVSDHSKNSFSFNRITLQ